LIELQLIGDIFTFNCYKSSNCMVK
jgi:hypothetical protein